MIWATVSSRSCFCWLCRASPFLAAKNIINLISVLTIWWCPCVALSLVLLEKGVCYDQHFLLVKLLAFALLHFVLQGQTCLLLQLSFDCLILHSNPLAWKEHLLLVLDLEGLWVLIELVSFSFFSINDWDIDLDYSNVDWFALETNRSFCCFWDCTQALHFGLLCSLWELLHFFQGVLALNNKYNGHLN